PFHRSLFFPAPRPPPGTPPPLVPPPKAPGAECMTPAPPALPPDRKRGGGGTPRRSRLEFDSGTVGGAAQEELHPQGQDISFHELGRGQGLAAGGNPERQNVLFLVS